MLLQLAEEQNTYPQLSFARFDMRHIPYRDEFDIVVNLFTSFGYFSSDEENEQVIRNMAQALKAGGEVVIDYLNPAYVKKNLVPHSTKEVNGMLIEEKRWIEDETVKKRILIRDDSAAQPREYMEQVRLYSVEQMTAMLERAGLGQIQVFGNYQFEPYRASKSPRMIFYAIKR